MMTFMVNHMGEVFQKDLGAKTSQIAVRHDGVQPGSHLATCD